MSGEVRLSERFWSRVEKEPDDGCWVWTGCRSADGYGTVGISGRQYRTHRLTYEHLVGPIPDALVIDHLCRVRHCCNPGHLEPVTIAENNRRGVGGWNLANGETCRAGLHPWPESAIVRASGFKGCIECRRACDRRRDAVMVECKFCGVMRRRTNIDRHRRTHTEALLSERTATTGGGGS